MCSHKNVDSHTCSPDQSEKAGKTKAFPALVRGESAVEAIADENTLVSLPAMPANVSPLQTGDATFSCDTCMFETCCSPDSVLSQVVIEKGIPAIRLHKDGFDISKRDDVDILISQISRVRHPVVWVALPCTPWTQWQNVCQHLYGEEYRANLHRRRVRSRIMLRNALRAGEQALSQGGKFVFEWPRRA